MIQPRRYRLPGHVAGMLALLAGGNRHHAGRCSRRGPAHRSGLQREGAMHNPSPAACTWRSAAPMTSRRSNRPTSPAYRCSGTTSPRWRQARPPPSTRRISARRSRACAHCRPAITGCSPSVNIYTEFKRTDGHTVWLHMDQWEGQDWKHSPGNLYGAAVKVHFDPASPTPIRLVADKVIAPIEVRPIRRTSSASASGAICSASGGASPSGSARQCCCLAITTSIRRPTTRWSTATATSTPAHR